MRYVRADLSALNLRLIMHCRNAPVCQKQHHVEVKVK